MLGGCSTFTLREYLRINAPCLMIDMLLNLIIVTSQAYSCRKPHDWSTWCSLEVFACNVRHRYGMGLAKTHTDGIIESKRFIFLISFLKPRLCAWFELGIIVFEALMALSFLFDSTRDKPVESVMKNSPISYDQIASNSRGNLYSFRSVGSIWLHLHLILGGTMTI